MGNSRNTLKIADMCCVKALLAAQQFRTDSKQFPYPLTPNYLAPEIIQHEIGPSILTEEWALGCIIYEINMLFRAFEGEHTGRILEKILALEYEPMYDHATAISRGIVKLLLTAQEDKRTSTKDLLELISLYAIQAPQLDAMLRNQMLQGAHHQMTQLHLSSQQTSTNGQSSNEVVKILEHGTCDAHNFENVEEMEVDEN
ncbi:hypothetical protein PMAYCL1PPCAC_26203 [Pristionchus mayeri]|uniref:non-specific serine/threonine protein kinase n=1 Tax=Pristionchus mayeri TaxID=1317129 RepID=A0AAN5I824_9BILA|nr:hypothetical protein PMAYCL1PPCAC_26203 [Pristionchus mayeri]